MNLKITKTLAFLLFILAGFYGCKKEATISSNKNYTDVINLNDAKVFFKNTILPNSPLTLAKKELTNEQILANENIDDLLYKEPIWEKAYRKTINGKIGIAIPIHFKISSFIRTGEKTGVNFEKLNYLLIYKNNESNLNADWVTLTPDIEWIKGNRKNYIGRIKVADWDGNIKKVFSFDKAGKILSYRRAVDENLMLSSWTNVSFKGSYNDYGKIMSIPNIVSDNNGRKYKDINGDCWENIREVQAPSGGLPGVTLHRKKIDCAELEPPRPVSGPTNGESPLPGGGNGGSGGSSYAPENCNDDPNYDPSKLPPLSGGLEYVPKCGPPVIEEPEPEPNTVPPSCRSFNYSKVTNNWQTAGVKNIFQTYVYFLNNESIAIQVEFQPLYFQMPYSRLNGQNFSGQGIAATKSAEILQDAFKEGNTYFKSQAQLGYRGAFLKSRVQSKILEYANNIMNSRYGGNVTISAPLGFNGTLTNYVDYYFFADDCTQ